MPDHNPDKHDSDSISISPGLHATQPGPASRSSSYNYNYRSHNTTPLSMQSSSLQTRPADTDTPDNAPNSRTRLLPSQPQWFSSASSSGNSVSMTGPHAHAHPAQTSMPAIAPALPRRWSRLPTPTYQPNPNPNGGGYSHEMYKREARRGVISSLGRKCTTRLRRAASGVVMSQESTSSSSGKRVTSDSGVITVQRTSPGQVGPAGPGPAPKSRLRIPSNNTRRRTMLPLPLAQTQTHPKSGSTSTLSLLPSHTAKTKTSATETTTELLGSGSSSPDDSEWPLPHAVPHPVPRSKRPGPGPNLRKVRVKLHSLSLPQRHDDDEPSTTADTGAGTEYSPHRELSSTFARIKDEMAPRKMWAQHGPQQGFRAGRDTNNNRIGVRAFGFEGTENQRGAVSSKTGFSPGCVQFSAGSVASRGRTSRDRDPSERMVSEAKPKHYWLGRFVTLTNAFHYEDSFSEPDVATGFGMLSSYSFPAKDDADRSGYRVRRAFMVLENVCVTDEASWSFRRFRDEYVARYGRWVGYGGLSSYGRESELKRDGV